MLSWHITLPGSGSVRKNLRKFQPRLRSTERIKYMRCSRDYFEVGHFISAFLKFLVITSVVLEQWHSSLLNLPLHLNSYHLLPLLELMAC